jgi:hypothetical protein
LSASARALRAGRGCPGISDGSGDDQVERGEELIGGGHDEDAEIRGAAAL